jgi:hypothetical protein
MCGVEKTVDDVEKLFQDFLDLGGNYLTAASTGS